MTTRISGRNQLPGQVIAVTLGDLMAEVSVQVGEQVIDAIITRRSAENLEIKVGDTVRMLIKATEVMVIKETPN